MMAVKLTHNILKLMYFVRINVWPLVKKKKVNIKLQNKWNTTKVLRKFLFEIADVTENMKEKKEGKVL